MTCHYVSPGKVCKCAYVYFMCVCKCAVYMYFTWSSFPLLDVLQSLFIYIIDCCDDLY